MGKSNSKSREVADLKNTIKEQEATIENLTSLMLAYGQARSQLSQEDSALRP